MKQEFEIIDFHTHPFIEARNNICAHLDYCDMDSQKTKDEMEFLGISKICGSVIKGALPGDTPWTTVERNNETALKLKELYGDFYVPGFHIHPDYPEESIAEMEKMHTLGVNLIGELVPYLDGWSCKYDSPVLSDLLDHAGRLGMIVSFHSMDEDAMDVMVASHPDVVFVAAHPGERAALLRHIDRAKKHENYYLDLSGTGIFRYGMLRRAIDEMGVDRILFGTDFPTCAPGVYLGGVLYDRHITDTEREKILSLNAKRLLNL